MRQARSGAGPDVSLLGRRIVRTKKPDPQPDHFSGGFGNPALVCRGCRDGSLRHCDRLRVASSPYRRRYTVSRSAYRSSAEGIHDKRGIGNDMTWPNHTGPKAVLQGLRRHVMRVACCPASPVRMSARDVEALDVGIGTPTVGTAGGGLGVLFFALTPTALHGAQGQEGRRFALTRDCPLRPELNRVRSRRGFLLAGDAGLAGVTLTRLGLARCRTRFVAGGQLLPCADVGAIAAPVGLVHRSSGTSS